jgi:hypothetical protein
MALPIISVLTLGIVGAVGAKIGTDHVYPWLAKNVKLCKNKLTKIISEARVHAEIIKNMENI